MINKLPYISGVANNNKKIGTLIARSNARVRYEDCDDEHDVGVELSEEVTSDLNLNS